MAIRLTMGLIKKAKYKWVNISEENVKIELDLSNYVTKADLNNSVVTSDFPKKPYLASLKWDVDELDLDQLSNVPSSLNSLKRS